MCDLFPAAASPWRACRWTICLLIGGVVGCTESPKPAQNNPSKPAPNQPNADQPAGGESVAQTANSGGAAVGGSGSDAGGANAASVKEPSEPNSYEIEVTDYKPPADPYEGLLADDRLGDKTPVFDPLLVHPEPRGEFSLNLSGAVLGLDTPMVLPDQEPHLLALHPSYAAALKAGPGWPAVLPSVFMLDGKAKQFDDGLYAAIETAYYDGIEGSLAGHVDIVRRLLTKVGPGSPAAPFLAAALTIAGEPGDAADQARRNELVEKFLSDPLRSKPIGFYTWNEKLQKCFRFLRFLATEFTQDDLETPRALAAALADDETLRADYVRASQVFAGLTNPFSTLSVDDLVGVSPLSGEAFLQTCAAAGVSRQTVSLYPPSGNRESELFLRLFPRGLTPDANLMKELITAIRTGAVDLAPRPNSGWYEHQVYALETLVLPERGGENSKLLLSKGYKRRMLDAFAALMTKRRETHARSLDMPRPESAVRLEEPIEPRLRVEPCATYYLRTARSYAFLEGFLSAALGADLLATLHGQTQTGPRRENLAAELAAMRDLFYGLHLVAAEDVGIAPAFADDEPVDQGKCRARALGWLQDLANDADLAADTRVSVPVFGDAIQGKTRLWSTLGVRYAKLTCRFARPPSVRPKSGAGEWQVVRNDLLRESYYLVLVDEFAEIELPGLQCFDRAEWRKICDEHKTRDAILAALQSR